MVPYANISGTSTEASGTGTKAGGSNTKSLFVWFTVVRI